MTKRTYTAEYKAKIVLELLKEELHISEIASREEISHTQLQNWKKEFLGNAPLVFSQTKLDSSVLRTTFLKKYKQIHGRDYD